MDKWLCPTFYNGHHYLSMMWLDLIHVTTTKGESDMCAWFRECVVFQMTLSRRNGTNSNDYSAAWWDTLPVEGIVTSYVRLDILSRYVQQSVFKVIQLELYSGTGKCLSEWSWPAFNSLAPDRLGLRRLFITYPCFKLGTGLLYGCK